MHYEIQLDHQFFPRELWAAAEKKMPQALQALTAIRDHKGFGADWCGWFDYPKTHGTALVETVTKYVRSLDLPYDLVLVIGIGGSYLGTRAVGDALGHEFAASLPAGAAKRPLLVYCGQHLSETSLLELMDLLEQHRPIVNVISKSGTTTEPSVAFRVVRQHLEKRFGKAEAARRIVATTDSKKGALRHLADEQGYKSFVVPDDIGGRYSVLSAVGLVPLALAGFDIGALMQGAEAVFRELNDAAAAKTHPILQYAAARNAAYDAGKALEILAYSEPKLRNFGEWWKQLFGESEGKDHKGLMPMGLALTTDLHSLGQIVQDGQRNILETFLSFDRKSGRTLSVPKLGDNSDELEYLEGQRIDAINSAAMLATKIAHADGEVPCLELRVAELNEHGIGALFAFFETACAVSGTLLGVNPFNQPGVEAYKKNLFGLLGKPGFEKLGSELKKRLARS